MRMHRAVEGDVKDVTAKHTLSGQWYAYLLVDDGRGSRDPMVIENAVGIDIGLEHFVVYSDGHEVEKPRYLKRELKRSSREQRPLQRAEGLQEPREATHRRSYSRLWTGNR